MSPNINDPEACRQAGELPRLTGETTTGAVTVAVLERLGRERRKRDATLLAQELHAIGRRCAALLAPGPAAVEHGDLLYGDRGLPK
ncbi:MAG: type II toxin-antitoxin system VapB family antitoxin [Caldilineaceae bacterium]|nr:type II toxin-antitoxin system VapB family antitoxin [Caldilineaceae bacterium]MDE0462144.1 type II toxin-antitoxin system VapB family antitoxin [Caldilineaceae bacterium]